jgi:hypothetical protein
VAEVAEEVVEEFVKFVWRDWFDRGTLDTGLAIGMVMLPSVGMVMLPVVVGSPVELPGIGADGDAVGDADGDAVGEVVGTVVGMVVGAAVANGAVGMAVGEAEGEIDGDTVGSAVGTGVVPTLVPSSPWVLGMWQVARAQPIRLFCASKTT